MSRADVIAEKLSAAFSPQAIRVDDESGRHAGHAGARPEGETHFSVRIVADAFQGLSRVERQRRVYAELKAEFDAGLHALSLQALTPSEAASRAE